MGYITLYRFSLLRTNHDKSAISFPSGPFTFFLNEKTMEYNQVLSLHSLNGKTVEQGMADGSASKPALRQDTSYMVEKTYLDIAPYLGAFGAYLMPQ